MRYIKTFENYEVVTEGKVSQFVIMSIFKIFDAFSYMSKKLKGKPISNTKFKDKKVEKQFYKDIVSLIDYSFFDALKYGLFKKTREKSEEVGTLSGLIKNKTGVDVYDLVKSIKDKLVIDNFVYDNREEFEDTLKKLESGINSFFSLIVKCDDDIKDTIKLKDSLKKISKEFEKMHNDMMKALSKEEHTENALRGLDRTMEIIKDYDAPKHIDEILDKISKWGSESLTEKEKKDLEVWSKSI
jgi:hypothetical protein